ncbi:3-hexulose-6-phosphate synthase [Streptomyces sp. NPDC090442]|uniref:3-hexulose-6-phosphate synthase n=1 Tax=Streptomyces sp. NPDC090442 TaxID=3365962 RepID=UPI003823232E
MKLQAAMDVTTTRQALDLAAKVAPWVDILELGTPLIKNEGLGAVRAVKEAHSLTTVFADLKTADAGELEADLAFSAGADLVTVLGTAGDSTIAGAVRAAERNGKAVVVDLIGVADKAVRARAAIELGARFVEMHAGLDEQAEKSFNLQRLLDAGRASGVPFSVAGGVNATTLTAVRDAGAVVAVVGGALYNAPDPARAAQALRTALG